MARSFLITLATVFAFAGVSAGLSTDVALADDPPPPLEITSFQPFESPVKPGGSAGAYATFNRWYRGTEKITISYAGIPLGSCEAATAVGWTCGASTPVEWSQNLDPAPMLFTATVSGSSDAGIATGSESTYVDVEQVRWEVSLTTNKDTVTVPDSTYMVATAGGGTSGATPYTLKLKNADTGSVIAECFVYQACGTTYTAEWSENTSPGTHSYSAYVSWGGHIASNIATLTIEVEPFHFELSMTASPTKISYPGSSFLQATITNRPQYLDPSYSVKIRDDTTGQIIVDCAYWIPVCGTTFYADAAHNANSGRHHFSAWASSPTDSSHSATAEATVTVDNPNSLVGDPEAAAGDPVDAVSGNFALAKTDVRAIGVAEGVEMTRMYNSRDSRSSRLGPGWSWPGTERLSVLAYGDVRIVMADGKTLDFSPDASGGFKSPYGQELELKYTGSTYVLSDPYGLENTVYAPWGDVISKRDENGRTRNYGYSYGYLVSIASGSQSVTFGYNQFGLLGSVTDSSGRTASYEYASGRLAKVVNPEGESVEFTYDANGLLASATNPDGKLAVSNEYDAKGRVTEQQVGAAAPAVFDYEEGETTYTDAEGGEHRIAFDDAGKPSAFEGPEGSSQEITRRADGRITAIEAADGSTTEYEYDAHDRLKKEIDPAGGETVYAYDSDSNLTQVTDPLGHTNSFTYDSDRNPTSSTNALGKTTTFTWDGPGLLESKTDPLGRTTTYDRDSSGRVTSVTDALGHTSSVTYGADGQVETSTDPLGRTSEFEYSPMGRLEEATNPLGKTTTSSYDEAGNLVISTDERGVDTATEFDAFERPIATRVDGVLVSETGYDDNGNAVFSRDGNGSTSWTAFDGEGRATSETTPEGSQTSYEYDELGRKVSEEDPRGGVTSYEYDLAGNLTSVEDAEGALTQYGYDAAGNMTSETDALGRVTTYEYDAANQLIREEKPLGLVTEYAYDDAGQLTSKDVAGEITTYAYDALGRLTGADPEVGSARAFTYDAAGQMTAAAVTGGGSTAFSYDLAGRVSGTTDALGLATTYAYDDAGNATSMTDSAGTTTIEYDAQSRPTKLTAPSGREHEFTYDPAGNPVEQRTYKPQGGGRVLVAKTERNYDLDGQMLSQTTKDAAGTEIAELTYSYDDSGNPTSRVAGTSEQQYAYDAVNRIKQVTFANSSDTYSYDALGNRTAKNGSSYTYNALGELTSSPGGVTYGYDDQGRRTSRTDSSGTESYSWDSFDQLTQTAGAQTSSYTYDALGRLTGTTTGPFTRTYNYALGDSPVRISSTLTGPPTLSNSEFLTYGPKGLIESSVGGAITYPLADNVGTLTGSVSDAGTFSPADELDPLGVPTGLASAAGYDRPTLGFSGAFGRESLPSADLVKMGARQYDASVGAFVSRDPVTGGASEPARRIPYAFANSGPAKFVDLDGRSFAIGCALGPESPTCWLPAAAEAAAAIGAAAGGYYFTKKYAQVAVNEMPKPLSSSAASEGTAPFGSPGPDFEWRGPKDKGSWYNPKTGEYWRPDPIHPPPVGPHWDHRDADGEKWRVHPDGRAERKNR